MATKTPEELIVKLKSAIERHQGTLDEWQGRFSKNPYTALQWGESVYEAAARQSVCRTLLGWIEGIAGRDAEMISKLAEEYHCEPDPHSIFWAYLRSEAGQRVRFSRSTSRTHNLIQEYESEAWVDIAFGGSFGLW